MKTELCKLFERYGSDKCPHYFHTYSEHYYDIFNPIRDDVRLFIEIGVGNHELMAGRIVPRDKYQAGASLRAWNDFFTHAHIYGLDINTTDFFEYDRVKCLWTDQSKPIELEKTFDEIKRLEGRPTLNADVILDDGSHIVDHQLLSIKTLAKYLKPGGLYIIEDIKTKDLGTFTSLQIDGLTMIKSYYEPVNKTPNQNSFVVYKKSQDNF
jgi:hypothetical protein